MDQVSHSLATAQHLAHNSLVQGTPQLVQEKVPHILLLTLMQVTQQIMITKTNVV